MTGGASLSRELGCGDSGLPAGHGVASLRTTLSIKARTMPTSFRGLAAVDIEDGAGDHGGHIADEEEDAVRTAFCVVKAGIRVPLAPLENLQLAGRKFPRRNQFIMCLRTRRCQVCVASEDHSNHADLVHQPSLSCTRRHRRSDGLDHIDSNPARAAARVTRVVCAMRPSSMGSPVVTMR
jgi:hypothetical protein